MRMVECKRLQFKSDKAHLKGAPSIDFSRVAGLYLAAVSVLAFTPVAVSLRQRVGLDFPVEGVWPDCCLAC